MGSLFQQWKGTLSDLYRKELAKGAVFSIRSMDMGKDLPIIHEWVNMDYAIQFWQMDGPVAMLQKMYEEVMSNPNAHSFIGCLDGIPVCQVDAYDPRHDEVGDCYRAREGDIGIHLIMGPLKQAVTNLSAKIVMAFCELFFNHPNVQQVVAEPDIANRPANWLLHRLKFDLIGRVELSTKSANLYCLSRDSYEKLSINLP